MSELLFEPGAAGCEARILPLCYDAPFELIIGPLLFSIFSTAPFCLTQQINGLFYPPSLPFCSPALKRDESFAYLAL